MSRVLETIAVEKQVPKQITCDGCGATTSDVMWGVLPQGTVLILGRGYYAYDDGNNLTFDLCRECVDKLFKLFPRMKELGDLDEASLLT